VNLLRAVRTLTLDESKVFLGQFGAFEDEVGYLDDPTVPAGSRCPTFASVLLEVDNDRWRGVPFLFTAGKGMDERVCELRIRFKPNAAGAMFAGEGAHNELVLRVQPDESLYLITVAKEPGITSEQVRKPVVMDMNYGAQFTGAYVGDAYERMILNAARGEQSLFVSDAELVEAWRIFTPLLHQIDAQKPQPVAHPFGSLPAGFIEFAAKFGVVLKPSWHEFIALNADHVDELKKVFAELDHEGDGRLNYSEVAELAKRFYDGREPTEKRIAKLFRDAGASVLTPRHTATISLDQLIASSQKMHNAFAKLSPWTR